MSAIAYTAPWGVLPDDDNARVRASLAALRDNWVAAGLVQTSDTGQIDPDTFEWPGGTDWGSRVGYFMFRFSDALQATHPVFLRLDLLLVTGEDRGLVVELRVYRGTDGAGVGSGLLYGSRIGMPPTTAAAGNPSYAATEGVVSAGDGWFAWFLHVVGQRSTSPGSSSSNTGPGGVALIVERSRDANGNLTGDGLMVAHSWYYLGSTAGVLTNTGAGVFRSGGPLCVAINYATGGQNVGAIPAVLPYNVDGMVLGEGTSLTAGGVGPVFPWTIIAPGVAPWQSHIAASVAGADYPTGGVLTTRLHGQEQRMLVIRTSDQNNLWGCAPMFERQASTAPTDSAWVAPAIAWPED